MDGSSHGNIDDTPSATPSDDGFWCPAPCRPKRPGRQSALSTQPLQRSSGSGRNSGNGSGSQSLFSITEMMGVTLDDDELDDDDEDCDNFYYEEDDANNVPNASAKTSKPARGSGNSVGTAATLPMSMSSSQHSEYSSRPLRGSGNSVGTAATLPMSMSSSQHSEYSSRPLRGSGNSVGSYDRLGRGSGNSAASSVDFRGMMSVADEEDDDEDLSSDDDDDDNEEDEDLNCDNDSDDSDDSDLDPSVMAALRMTQVQADMANRIPNSAGRKGRARTRIVTSFARNTQDSFDSDDEEQDGSSSGGGRPGLGSRMDSLSSMRRTAITTDALEGLAHHIFDLEMQTKGKDWITSFRDLDPRHQILHFFNDLSLEGVENFESQGLKGAVHIPWILRGFIKAGIFSVWRPTSNDAIRKMISGEGVGKGLEIKGKSAKCGEYSGFVPFLQIHNNDHKSDILPMRSYQRVRVFYPNKESRDEVYMELSMSAKPKSSRATLNVVRKNDDKPNIMARPPLRSQRSSLGPSLANEMQEEGKRNVRLSSMLQMGGFSDDKRKTLQAALNDSNRNLLTDKHVDKIDDYISTQGVYGLDIPEKLFWETFVVPNDITRTPGSKYETGRPSMPEFQQMNIETLRNWSDKADSSKGDSSDAESDPRPVLWHGGCGRIGEDQPQDCNPMCPLGLLMAYEENSKVIPVVSDFDCFLLGTRGVKYSDPLGEQELSTLTMCIEEIEGILSTPKKGCWTQRWLEVKKKHAEQGDKSPEMPKFGYADPRSYKIMTGAVHRLKTNGAVRHGPECFNYGFPQDLDDSYLVISDTFDGVPWRYANSEQLIDILSEKIDQGFTFPLNPKWVLCDPGWKVLYDKMLASQKMNVQDSQSIWYPDEIRKQIDSISSKYPDGFVDTDTDTCALDSGVQADLAELELKRFKTRMESTRRLQKAISQIASSRKIRRGSGSGPSDKRLQMMKRWDSARTFKDEVQGDDDTKNDGSMKDLDGSMKSAQPRRKSRGSFGPGSLIRGLSATFLADVEKDDALDESVSTRGSRRGIGLKKAISFKRKEAYGSQRSVDGSQRSVDLSQLDGSVGEPRASARPAMTRTRSLDFNRPKLMKMRSLNLNQETQQQPQACDRPKMRRTRSQEINEDEEPRPSDQTGAKKRGSFGFIKRAFKRSESERHVSDDGEQQTARPRLGGKARSLRNLMRK